MKCFYKLTNTFKFYNWGSSENFKNIFGLEISSFEIENPIAEMWLGDSSTIEENNQEFTLASLIERDVEKFLGKNFVGNIAKFPYLFKVLSVGSNLSIQVHPDRKTAVSGFAKENRQRFIDPEDRVYLDANPKNEMLYPLTEFHLLYGFRLPEEVKSIFQILFESSTNDNINSLLETISPENSNYFYKELWSIEQKEKWKLLNLAKKNLFKIDYKDETKLFKTLLEKYPDDIFALAPFFMNYHVLQEGEVLHIPPGSLHSYLSGVALEIMNNSDNTIRAGLTHKHIDLSELLAMVNFSDYKAKIIKQKAAYNKPLYFHNKEAKFSLLSMKVNSKCKLLNREGPEILLCVEGTLQIKNSLCKQELSVSKGESFFIPAFVKNYELKGNAKVFIASSA